MGAGRQISFPSVWLPPCRGSQPSPPPQLFWKFWRMSPAYVSLFQVLCVEWGCLLWWTGSFLQTVFYLHRSFFLFSFFFSFCIATYFLMMAVLQNWVCCLLRITVCHPLCKVGDIVSFTKSKCMHNWKKEIPGVWNLLFLHRKSRCV